MAEADVAPTMLAPKLHDVHGALAVEMEAAALYVFARTRRRDVPCFAHVTNRMAVVEGDFEKGEAGVLAVRSI